MSRTRIKICGITRPEDGKAAAALGADAIGLVFWSPSPRAVSISVARDIIAGLPPFISAFGLFVDPTVDEVNTVLESLALHGLQFHGSEDPAFCGQFKRPYLKAIPVGAGNDLLQYALRHPGASAFLFDNYQAGGSPGGTGHVFDWNHLSSSLRANLPRPVVLSGGLSSENVGSAIRQLRPAAVDVSSGVEAFDAQGQARKGIKDPTRIAAFIDEVKRADASL